MAPTLDPKAILTQYVDKYLKLPLSQKVLVPVLVVFPVWALIHVSKMATEPDYTVLYSDLSPGDASGVVDRLKDLKAKYKVDGDTVLVSPPELVHELRISLAADGVPKTGSVGFELFDGTNFATTTMGEMVKKQRAIQGELERTIMSLDSVLSARVHISQPEKTIFAKQAQDPGASVLLKLRSGGELDKKQIRGIANFVASSVEGLKPENVTIIDVYGNLLTPKDEEGDELGADATRLAYTREVERNYAQRIETMLAKVLGPGKVVARVTADLDFSSNEREEESYDPGGQVIRSERSIEEGAATTARGGVPGVAANLSNDPSLLSAPQGGNESNTRREAVKNFEVSRAIIKSSQAKGKLLRLSAAVLVDGKYEEVAVAGGGVVDEAQAAMKSEKVFKQLTPEMLAQVEGVVKSAIGYDSARGDVVTVENIPFFQADDSLKAELDKASEINAWFRYAALSVPILAILIFGVFVLRPMMKFLTSNPETEIDITRLLPEGMPMEALSMNAAAAPNRGAPAGGQPAAAEGQPGLAEAGNKSGLPDLSGPIDMGQLDEIMAESSRIVKENPTQAALLIRYWLNEGHL